MVLYPGIYLASFVFGGVFLALSLMSGGDDEADASHADGGADAGHDLDADAGGDLHADAGDADHGDGADHHGDHHELWDAAHAHGGAGKAVMAVETTISWFPYRSLRFWVFAATFFGLSGLLLQGMGLLEPAPAAFTSSAFGYFVGALAVNLLRQARRGDISTLVSPEELVGKVATVVLPVAEGGTGKIRVSTRTGMEDYLARPRDPSTRFAVQQRVLIDGFDGHRAIVAPIDADEA